VAGRVSEKNDAVWFAPGRDDTVVAASAGFYPKMEFKSSYQGNWTMICAVGNGFRRKSTKSKSPTLTMLVHSRNIIQWCDTSTRCMKAIVVTTILPLEASNRS